MPSLSQATDIGWIKSAGASPVWRSSGVQLYLDCIGLIRLQILMGSTSLIEHDKALVQLVDSILGLSIYLPLSIVLQWQRNYILTFVNYIQVNLFISKIINNYCNHGMSVVTADVFKPP